MKLVIITRWRLRFAFSTQKKNQRLPMVWEFDILIRFKHCVNKQGVKMIIIMSGHFSVFDFTSLLVVKTWSLFTEHSIIYVSKYHPNSFFREISSSLNWCWRICIHAKSGESWAQEMDSWILGGQCFARFAWRHRVISRERLRDISV